MKARRHSSTTARLFVWSRSLAACAAALVIGFTVSRLTAADDVLQRTRAMYGELRAYADTGVVIEEYGTGSKDRHTFTTFFSRAPRGFSFDFKRDTGERYVIWGDPKAFHTWWNSTGALDDYPNPNNTGAFSTAGFHTFGSALKIPTLLYARALVGDFTNFNDAVQDGAEVVSGHPCHRLVGTVYDTYGATGRHTNIHKLSVWVDAESLLIRKVVEESKPLPGQISRRTTTFEPQANPTLDDSRFRFTPPAPK